jgi:Derlin-2/3
MVPPPQQSVIQSALQWIDSIPVITRYLIFSTLALSLGAKLGFVNPIQIALLPPIIVKKYEIWRLATAHLFSSGQSMIWHLYLLYQNSKNLEENFYSNRKADFLFMILIIMVLLDVCSFGLY